MPSSNCPEQVCRIGAAEPFSFRCHPGLDCFTDCCRQLELVLTPYDVLRLRLATGLDSSTLLERFVIREQEAEEAFPCFYLTMVDDGRASCIFVNDSGCSVYEHRPGACRTYPLGRAVIREPARLSEFFVLVREPHCLGFREPLVQTPASYATSQGLGPYHQFNDLLARLQQHQRIRQGMRLSIAQADLYTLALYDLDRLRPLLHDGGLERAQSFDGALHSDDEVLLRLAFAWLEQELFG